MGLANVFIADLSCTDIPSKATEFIRDNLPSNVNVVSVMEQSSGPSQSQSAEDQDSSSSRSGPSVAAASATAFVAVAVVAAAFMLVRKVRRSRNDIEDSSSIGSIRGNLRASSKVKYTNGKRLTGDVGFPVSVNEAQNEYEVDSLVSL